jgi:hypothetical protein
MTVSTVRAGRGHLQYILGTVKLLLSPALLLRHPHPMAVNALEQQMQHLRLGNLLIRVAAHSACGNLT